MSDETQKIDPSQDNDKTEKIELLQETKRNLNAGKIVFSRFELIRELGSGGMGVVWLAKDLEVEGKVALKFLPGLVRDPIAERDLRDEVKNARDLVHENIVSVRTLHKDDTSIAVEMEYVDGPNVTMLMRDTANRCLDVDKAAEIVRGLCLAIDYAWTPPRKVVHRDIKPANMLVTTTGHVKVVDFGIAHTVSETITRLTGQSKSERVVGTLPYMSPQQLTGEVRHHNDVYAIGATIYQILTGTPPFRATDAAVLTQQINNEIPVTMAERRRQLVNEGRKFSGSIPIPKIWEEVVASCLAKDPAKRPATARQIAERLGLLDAPKSIPWLKISGGVAALAVVGVAVGIYFIQPAWLPKVNVSQKITGSDKTEDKNDNAGSQKVDDKSALKVDNKVESQNTPAPLPATVAPALRHEWYLTASEAVQVAISRQPDGVVENVQLHAGEKHVLPLDTAFLIQLKEGKGLGWEIDDHAMTPPDSLYHRWTLNVPAALNILPTISVPAPPFEEEVGPLLKDNQVNQTEADYLRAALGDEKNVEEHALAGMLFAKENRITIGQWRARTSHKFKPDIAVLTAEDPLLLARAIDIELLPGKLEMRLVRIEPGQFQRGSAPDELGRQVSDSAPGSVSITKPFFIGIFEVTQAQFISLMKRNPSWWHMQQHPRWPIDSVTGEELRRFFLKLNGDLAKAYGGLLVADLPTDDEWEYACRAGTTTAFNNGSLITSTESDPALKVLANYNNPNGTPCDVGSSSPNNWGLYDLHGNLEEWTKGWNLRGGSWHSRAVWCRAAVVKHGSREAPSSKEVGFRLVLRLREAK